MKIKNNLVKLVTFSIFLVTAFTFQYQINALEGTSEIAKEIKLEKEIGNYLKEKYGSNYIEIIQKNKISSENADKIISKFEKSQSEQTIYPDYVGGIYINDDNNLVLQVVEKKIPLKDSIKIRTYNDILNVDNDTIIQYANYSYSELESVMNQLNELSKSGKLNNIVKEFYIDVINNTVSVGLSDYNEDNINYFKNNILNTPIITFIQGRKFTSTADIAPGSPLFASGCSTGYRARRISLYNGFVTAGHCVSANEQTIYGRVEKRQFSGSIDAAWINTTNTNNSLSNRLFSYSISPTPAGNLALSDDTNYVQGKLISRIGQKTGYQAGKIDSPNISVTVDGVTLYDQVYTDVLQDFGDSGGIVYATATKKAMGIGTIKDVENNHMVFSRIDKINSAFGLSRY